ncbi:MAG: hypothetical protein WAZ14_02610 [Patescibacteria group bacterium]
METPRKKGRQSGGLQVVKKKTSGDNTVPEDSTEPASPVTIHPDLGRTGIMQMMKPDPTKPAKADLDRLLATDTGDWISAVDEHELTPLPGPKRRVSDGKIDISTPMPAPRTIVGGDMPEEPTLNGPPAAQEEPLTPDENTGGLSVDGPTKPVNDTPPTPLAMPAASKPAANTQTAAATVAPAPPKSEKPYTPIFIGTGDTMSENQGRGIITITTIALAIIFAVACGGFAVDRWGDGAPQDGDDVATVPGTGSLPAGMPLVVVSNESKDPTWLQCTDIDELYPPGDARNFVDVPNTVTTLEKETIFVSGLHPKLVCARGPKEDFTLDLTATVNWTGNCEVEGKVDPKLDTYSLCADKSGKLVSEDMLQSVLHTSWTKLEGLEAVKVMCCTGGAVNACQLKNVDLMSTVAAATP